MRYGYFDDHRREYVIERPDTPRPWSNYLGARQYGGVITQHAGGYSFVQSPGEGRFLRLRYNGVPADQPGRLFYLRDEQDGDYWSGAWQPVGKSLDDHHCVTRFGTGYAVMESEYRGIFSEATYFVPVDGRFEYWWLRVVNRGASRRRIGVFAFAEFSSEWNLVNDLLNLQYSQYIAQASYSDGVILASSCSRLPEDAEHFSNRDQRRDWWMTLSGSPVQGFDCDRDRFLGMYRGFHNPLAVELGRCGGSSAYGDNPCGALQTSLDLEPGESRDVVVMLGVGREGECRRLLAEGWSEPQRVARELDRLRAHWVQRLESFQADTPDAAFNSMVNVWGAYNALMTFEWSRSCSLVYTGDGRDGFGFRDTVQDCLGVTTAMPDEVRERLRLMLTGQESTGGARPEIQPWNHIAGRMLPTPAEKYRSDDCLWFFDAVPALVAELGDLTFYREMLPYADRGEATVLGHLRRALEFNLERTGRNGLPCGLLADWNDCLKLGYKGESVFVAMQVRYGLRRYAQIAGRLNEPAEVDWAQEELEKMDRKIRASCWDGNWYIWAIAEDGTVFGTHRYAEGQVYLNTQVWAVLSGHASAQERDRCLETVKERLASPYGVALCAPPFERTPVHVMRAVLFNPGCKENGGIFSHTQSWAVIAECLRGRGDVAWDYYRAYMPSAWNERAELREIEPYVHCQSTYSVFSPKAGVSRVPWLSGTASWSHYTAQQWILGIRPELEGLRIDPCIPHEWDGFTVRRRFRGAEVTVSVQNPQRICGGVRCLKVNGRVVEGNLVPMELLTDGARVEAVLEGRPSGCASTVALKECGSL